MELSELEAKITAKETDIFLKAINCHIKAINEILKVYGAKAVHSELEQRFFIQKYNNGSYDLAVMEMYESTIPPALKDAITKKAVKDFLEQLEYLNSVTREE